VNRFFVQRAMIECGSVRFSEDQRKQIRNVLRLGAGDVVSVFDGTGTEHTVELVSTEPECAGRINGTRELDTEPRAKLTLVQGLPKGEKTDLIIQKGTEVGVSRFVFINTSRSIPSISADRLPGRLARWRSIAREAAEQSGRGCVPEVDGILSLDQALGMAGRNGVFAWEQEKATALPQIMPCLAKYGEIFLFIGPEGGFTSDEAQRARDMGAVPVSLGARILRAETAAIVGSALIIYGIEALGGSDGAR